MNKFLVSSLAAVMVASCLSACSPQGRKDNSVIKKAGKGIADPNSGSGQSNSAESLSDRGASAPLAQTPGMSLLKKGIEDIEITSLDRIPDRSGKKEIHVRIKLTDEKDYADLVLLDDGHLDIRGEVAKKYLAPGATAKCTDSAGLVGDCHSIFTKLEISNLVIFDPSASFKRVTLSVLHEVLSDSNFVSKYSLGEGEAAPAFASFYYKNTVTDISSGGSPVVYYDLRIYLTNQDHATAKANEFQTIQSLNKTTNLKLRIAAFGKSGDQDIKVAPWDKIDSRSVLQGEVKGAEAKFTLNVIVGNNTPKQLVIKVAMSPG
jgi:hypothetical protein